MLTPGLQFRHHQNMVEDANRAVSRELQSRVSQSGDERARQHEVQMASAKMQHEKELHSMDRDAQMHKYGVLSNLLGGPRTRVLGAKGAMGR